MYNPVYFRPGEWRCKCGAVGCTAGMKPLSDRALKFIDILRAALGAPITITSGWRCPERNSSCGGVKNSLHLRGGAVDVAAENMEGLKNLVRRLSALPDFAPDETQYKAGYIHLGWK